MGLKPWIHCSEYYCMTFAGAVHFVLSSGHISALMYAKSLELLREVIAIHDILMCSAGGRHRDIRDLSWIPWLSLFSRHQAVQR